MSDTYLQRFACTFSSLALAASIAGCGAKAEPVAAETKKFRPVDDSAPAASNAATETSATASDAPAGFSARQRGPASTQSTSAKENNAGADGSTAATPGAPAKPVGGELASILDQLNRLARQQPKGTTQQEQLGDLVQIQNQRLTLAKKALALKPEPEMKRQLVMAMYEVYQTFTQLRVPSAMAQLADFGKTMAADADPEVARIGRHAAFSANLSRIASQPLENGKEVATEAKKLLDVERGQLSQDTLQLVGQTADMLTEGGFKADAAGIIEMLAEALAADPKMAEQAPRYALVAKVVRMDLDALLENVVRERPEANAQIEAAVQTLLTEMPPSRELLNRTQTIAHILEATGHSQSAQACYDKIAAAFSAASEPELVASVKDLADKAKLRMSLVGQPLTVEGVTVDGSPFDWSAYAGKVVLVDFWATWCGPCIEELPNIRQNFEQYHAKGFEVVGVNLDTRAADVKQFLALQDLPWATVTSQVVLDGKVSDGDWSKIPMAAKCGVQAIPFVVLIGKDGNVDSIHVRGPKLRTRLTELLGPPITTEVPADPTQPAAPRATPPAGKQSKAVPSRGAATPVALFMAQAIFAADPPVASEDAELNPYLAKPGLSASQLIAFIQKMLDRPQVIQTRDGFAEAIVEACDRVLSASPAANDAEQLIAVETKLALLHREACDGKETADKQLLEFVQQLKDDSRPKIAHEVTFFRLERRVLDAKDLPLDEIPALLKAVQEYVAKEKLTAKHLRLASSTVAAINRLESGDEREAQFAAFGKLFAKSSAPDLARYGKKLAKKPASEEAAANR